MLEAIAHLSLRDSRGTRAEVPGIARDGVRKRRRIADATAPGNADITDSFRIASAGLSVAGETNFGSQRPAEKRPPASLGAKTPLPADLTAPMEGPSGL